MQNATPGILHPSEKQLHQKYWGFTLIVPKLQLFKGFNFISLLTC